MESDQLAQIRQVRGKIISKIQILEPMFFFQNDVDCQLDINTVHYNMQYQKNLMSKSGKSGQVAKIVEAFFS